MRLGPALLLLSLSLAACSEDPVTIGGDAGSDAAVARDDAAAVRDDAAATDAGPTPADAAPTDAGSDDDARVPDDAATDAGTSPVDGGPPCREATIPPPASCGAACGNGARDTCEICPSSGGNGSGDRRPPPTDAGVCETVVETCDQADLAGESCTTRGWAWGQLGCTNTCTFDDGRCASCAQALATTCREGDLDGRDNIGFDLAATSSAIAVTWVTQGLTVAGGSAVHVAILAPDLTETARRACFSAAGDQASIVDDGAGWLLALADEQALRLLPLDAAGLPSGPERTIPGARFPRLAASTSGARALLYLAADGRLTFELLGPGGALRSSVRPFADPPVDALLVSAAGHADRWFVAARTDGAQVATFDGSLRPVNTIAIDGASTEYPMIAAGPGGAFLSYAEFGGAIPEMRAAFVGDDGRRVGAPRTLGRLPDYFNPSPTTYDGTTAHVLLAGHTGSTGAARALTLGQVTAAAGLGALAPVASAAEIRDMRIIAIGRTAVIGWRVAPDAPGRGRIAVAHLPLN